MNKGIVKEKILYVSYSDKTIARLSHSITVENRRHYVNNPNQKVHCYNTITEEHNENLHTLSFSAKFAVLCSLQMAQDKHHLLHTFPSLNTK